MVALPPLVREAIERWRRAIADRFGGRLDTIRLFGSYARGEARPDSDVDLLTVINGLTREEWHEACGFSYEILLETGVYLSGLTCSREEWRTLRARERLLALDNEREGVPP
ncbi:MAG: nucleotidyltransferase domain-containing protein [Deltaproteobacteria bacterium]|nr:nucleotidyltransferase domain-containing protein [Deltaproteobacteria bacterium]